LSSAKARKKTDYRALSLIFPEKSENIPFRIPMILFNFHIVFANVGLKHYIWVWLMLLW